MRILRRGSIPVNGELSRSPSISATTSIARTKPISPSPTLIWSEAVIAPRRARHSLHGQSQSGGSDDIFAEHSPSYRSSTPGCRR